VSEANNTKKQKKNAEPPQVILFQIFQPKLFSRSEKILVERSLNTCATTRIRASDN
jgi:hypothetical protein